MVITKLGHWPFGILMSVLIASAQLPDMQSSLKQMGWRQEHDAPPVIGIGLTSKTAILEVSSPIRGLRFESNNLIISQSEKSAGQYQVILAPGRHLLRAISPGYATLDISGLLFKAGNGITISIFERDATPANACVRLWCGDTTCMQLEGEIDGRMMPIPRKNGHLTFCPGAGLHTMKLKCGQRMWERQYNLLSGDELKDTVNFDITDTTQIVPQGTGTLIIESTPDRATVYLNGILLGLTPFEVSGVVAGDWIVKVEKDLYICPPQKVTMHENEIRTVPFTLILNSGQVYVTSDPPGAQVSLEEVPSSGTTILGGTPVEKRVKAGTYVLHIQREHYSSLSDTLTIYPGDDRRLEPYRLSPEYAKVTITSEPPGANIEVDSQPWGKTPHTQDTVAFGPHVLQLTKENYLDEERAFTVQDTSAIYRAFPLQLNVGWISVTSEPESAEVILETTGLSLGVTPLTDALIAPGLHTIRIKKPLYESEQRSISVKASEHVPAIHSRLKRARGKLRVLTTPPEVTVSLDGMAVGTSPLSTDSLFAGLHMILLEKDRYDPIERKLMVAETGVTLVKDTLSDDRYQDWSRRRRVSHVVAAVIPGGGQFVSRQFLRGLFYFAIVGTSYHMAGLASQHYHNAEDLHDHWLVAASSASTPEDSIRYRTYAHSAQASSDKYLRNARMYTALWIAGYVIQAADAAFFGGGRLHSAPSERELPDDSGRIRMGVGPASLNLRVRL